MGINFQSLDKSAHGRNHPKKSGNNSIHQRQPCPSFLNIKKSGIIKDVH